MKRWSGSAGRPRKSVTNQFAIAAKNAAIPHSVSHTKCGKASGKRKKTVRRDRCRSSVTCSRIGSLR